MNKRSIIAVTGDYNPQTGLYYLKQEYMNAIWLAGGAPVVLYPKLTIPREWSGEAAKWLEQYALEPELLEAVDGILFTGGGDVDPAFYGEAALRENGEICPFRDVFEIRLVSEAVRRNIPCFGICRGIQLMAAAMGAKICQDIFVNGAPYQHQQKAPTWYPTHSVHTEEGSQLRQILGASARVNSFHHQAIAKGQEYPFEITAYSEDGVIEGIEKPELAYFVAVQWHPERMMQDPLQRALFETFVRKAAEYGHSDR